MFYTILSYPILHCKNQKLVSCSPVSRDIGYAKAPDQTFLVILTHPIIFFPILSFCVLSYLILLCLVRIKNLSAAHSFLAMLVTLQAPDQTFLAILTHPIIFSPILPYPILSFCVLSYLILLCLVRIKKLSAAHPFLMMVVTPQAPDQPFLVTLLEGTQRLLDVEALKLSEVNQGLHVLSIIKYFEQTIQSFEVFSCCT